MASLEKMDIMGIRSFSHTSHQTIKFFRPLTLILGPNGTGKTTIIECLRYMTTGDFPPFSDKGQAFVHDPQMVNETEVKAQIKLHFTDIQKCKVVTTRSMLVTQKLKKVEFKSLPGTLCQTKDGKEKILSSRCSDMDIEMVAAVGVSKPILNNVIFCHQEDSNWPLAEGKTLKTKFDEIFAATRYIKGLDNIHKQRVSLEGDVKQLESDMRLFELHRTNAAKLHGELDRKETRLAASRDVVQNVLDKLQPIQDELDRIRRTEQNMGQVQMDLTRKETEFKIENKAYRELDTNITEKFEGSTSDLVSEKSNFGAQLLVKQRERDELDISISELERRYPVLTKERTNLLKEIGKLETEADNHKKNIQHRDNLIHNLCRAYALGVSVATGQALTDIQIRRVVEQLKVKIEERVTEQGVLKESFATEEKEIQGKINAQNEKKTKLEHTETMRKQQILANRREIGTINAELSRTQEAASRLHHIEEELQAKNRELQTVSGKLDSSVVQRDISSLQNEQSTLDQGIRQLDVEMMKLMEQVKVQAEFDGAEKDKASKNDAIRKLKSKHDDTLQHLLGSVPVDNYRNSLDKFSFQVSQEIRQLTEAQSCMGIELATSESNRKNKMDDLKRKEAELRDSEDRLIQIAGSRDLEVQLLELQESIRNLQDEKGSFAGEKTIHEKFLAKLRQTDPCCPLCHRDFAEQQEVEELVNEINKKLRLMPQDLAGKQRLLDDQQRKYQAILELKPVKVRVDALRDGEIPALKSSINKLNESVETVRRRETENDDMLSLKLGDKAAADSMVSDIGLLDQNMIDLKKIERRIVEIRSQLGVGGRTIDGVRQEKSDLQGKIDIIQETLKKKQSSLSEYLRVTQSLQADVNKLGADKVRIATDVQKVSQLEERKIGLTRDIDVYQKEIERARVQIQPIQQAIAALDKDKEKLLNKREHELDALAQFVNEAKSQLKEVDGQMQSIERYIASNSQDRQANKQQELDAVNSSIEQLDGKKKDYTNQLQKLSKDLDSHQARIRNLDDNHKLRIKQKKLVELKKEVEELTLKLGGFEIKTLHERKKTLVKKEQDLNKESQRAQGSQAELEQEIEKLQAELNLKDHLNADKNHKEALVKVTTARGVICDLRLYAAALDKAILQFHSVKMNAINKIIRELWIKTYKGNDMDYIEIQSDVEEVAKANSTSTSSRRKSYHYKVVMVKGNVVQAMRGRCSAGQKVLASLIIRLALAETFCLNCGILALDEPTTNLDRENIDSLAEALCNLVRMRSELRDFQLLIITHDEEFVERLGRSEFVNYFYRVSKDERGMSQLKKHTVEALLS